MVMALEAVTQLASEGYSPIAGYHLHNVRLQRAFIIPGISRGVEVQLSIRQPLDLHGKGVNGPHSSCTPTRKTLGPRSVKVLPESIPELHFRMYMEKLRNALAQDI